MKRNIRKKWHTKGNCAKANRSFLLSGIVIHVSFFMIDILFVNYQIVTCRSPNFAKAHSHQIWSYVYFDTHIWRQRQYEYYIQKTKKNIMPIIKSNTNATHQDARRGKSNNNNRVQQNRVQKSTNSSFVFRSYSSSQACLRVTLTISHSRFVIKSNTGDTTKKNRKKRVYKQVWVFFLSFEMYNIQMYLLFRGVSWRKRCVRRLCWVKL